MFPLEIFVGICKAWKKDVFSGPRGVTWAGTVHEIGARAPARAAAGTLLARILSRTSVKSLSVNTNPTFCFIRGRSFSRLGLFSIWPRMAFLIIVFLPNSSVASPSINRSKNRTKCIFLHSKYIILLYHCSRCMEQRIWNTNKKLTSCHEQIWTILKNPDAMVSAYSHYASISPYTSVNLASMKFRYLMSNIALGHLYLASLQLLVNFSSSLLTFSYADWLQVMIFILMMNEWFILASSSTTRKEFIVIVVHMAL